MVGKAGVLVNVFKVVLFASNTDYGVPGLSNYPSLKNQTERVSNLP